MRIAAGLVCLLCVRYLSAAAYTSKSTTGDWNDPGVWSQGVVPGDGDTATLANGAVITIPAGVTVIVGDAAVPTVPSVATAGTNGTGQLVVSGVLVVKANVVQGNARWVFHGGSVLEFNNPAALTWQVGQSSFSNTALDFAGTAGSRVTVRSNPAGANGRFTYPGLNGSGLIRADYTDFLRIGSSSSPMSQHWSSGVRFLHCTFDACGRIQHGVTIANGSSFRVEDSLFRNSAGSSNVDLSLSTMYTTGVRTLVRNDFDKPVRLIGGQNIQFRYNTIQSGASAKEFDLTAGQAPEVANAWTDNLIWRQNAAGGGGPIPGGETPMRRHYWVFDFKNSNPHGIGSIANNAYLEDFVFDGCGLTAAGSHNGDIIFNKYNVSTVSVLSVSGALLLPTAAGYQTGKLQSNTNSPGTGSFDIRLFNNTVFTGGVGETGVLQWGETWAGASGACTRFENNLAVRAPSETAGGLLISRINLGSVQDFVAPVLVRNNAAWKCATGTDGYGYNTNITAPTASAFSVRPEAALNADPRFADPTRNIRTWDAHLGGPGTIANAFAEIRKRNDPAATYNPAYNVSDLIDWVRAGYMPQNPALWSGGYNGAFIGAVDPTGLRRVAGAASVMQ